jgi:hypothetical protein
MFSNNHDEGPKRDLYDLLWKNGANGVG